MVSVIILDFDGVILESVSVKTDAFRKLFSVFPEHVERIVQFHIENGGLSRFDKFRVIYSDILHKNLTNDEFERLSGSFSDLVEEAVKAAPFVEGAPEFLERMHRSYKLYIVSATPEEELVRIVQKRRISNRFSGVFGAPVKKTDNIRMILKKNGILAHDAVFVGDAVNDWEAAQQTGVRFIGRIKQGDPDRFGRRDGIEKKIADLHELIEYIEQESA